MIKLQFSSKLYFDLLQCALKCISFAVCLCSICFHAVVRPSISCTEGMHATTTWQPSHLLTSCKTLLRASGHGESST